MSGPWSKKAADVEFGAKVSIFLVDGYAFVDKIGWDNYSEAELSIFVTRFAASAPGVVVTVKLL